MSGRWILAVAVMGCASAPERLKNPKRIPHRDYVAPVAQVRGPERVPAPDIDLSVLVPDFHDELRWPLTPMNHPVMEPKFPIAQAFAQPGIGWLELCGSGATNRYGREKELLSYLRGWCKAVEGDTDAACSNLAPLIHSTTPRLEAAVRNDIANILAQDHADKAEHYIRVNALRDVGLLDLLAANYVEVGTTADALAINRNAIDSDDYATPATKCIRWTKHIVLADDKASLLIKQVEQYATVPKNADPTCVREFAKLKCWAVGDCSAQMTQAGITDPFDIDVIKSLQAWGTTRKTDEWWRVVDRVVFFLSTPSRSTYFSERQLADIGVSAMENAVRFEMWLDGGCSRHSTYWIARNANTLAPFLDEPLRARMAALTQTCPAAP